MEEKRMFIDGDEVIVKRFVCQRVKDGNTIIVPAKDVEIEQKVAKFYLARRESGKLLIFNYRPMRTLTSKMSGPHKLGSWVPSRGWGNEFDEKSSQKYEEVTWDGEPVEVDLVLTSFKIARSAEL